MEEIIELDYGPKQSVNDALEIIHKLIAQLEEQKKQFEQDLEDVYQEAYKLLSGFGGENSYIVDASLCRK